MSKIKLPRKRKKNYIKKHGRSDYLLMVMSNEILFEDKPYRKDLKKFPKEYGKGRSRFTPIKYF